MSARRNGVPADVAIREADARDFSAYSDLTYDLVVTSPPYPNNSDYADATRIEMTFWREVTGWGDLHSVVRHRLVRSCSQHAAAEKLILVIGDSAPYGIHVPADRWLAELAQAFGFAVCRFEKLRDRNIKWKNRKHRVPLKEGLLWLQ